MKPSTFDPGRLGPPAGAKVAVVGGCGGMGRLLVKALLETGVKVAVLDLPASLEQNPPPPEVLALAMDGSDEASVEAAFAALRAQGWNALDGFVKPVALNAQGRQTAGQAQTGVHGGDGLRNRFGRC